MLAGYSIPSELYEFYVGRKWCPTQSFKPKDKGKFGISLQTAMFQTAESCWILVIYIAYKEQVTEVGLLTLTG